MQSVLCDSFCIRTSADTTHYLASLSSIKMSVFFEGFWKCPFESIVEANGDVSSELELSALHRSSRKCCRTLYMITKILIIRLYVQKTELLSCMHQKIHDVKCFSSCKTLGLFSPHPERCVTTNGAVEAEKVCAKV